MLIGGGKNHRMGLFDMVMIKDNHISAAGGIANAIRSVDEYLKQKKLEMDVEVRINIELSQILVETLNKLYSLLEGGDADA